MSTKVARKSSSITRSEVLIIKNKPFLRNIIFNLKLKDLFIEYKKGFSKEDQKARNSSMKARSSSIEDQKLFSK